MTDYQTVYAVMVLVKAGEMLRFETFDFMSALEFLERYAQQNGDPLHAVIARGDRLIGMETEPEGA